MIYSLPYISLIAFFGILAIFYDRTTSVTIRNNILLSCVMVLVVFFGFRGFCFYDWNSYYPAFHKYDLAYLVASPITDWPFEPSFSLLMTLCGAIYKNYHFFTLVCTLIHVSLILLFLRRHKTNAPLFFMIFLSMNGLGMLTDLMRNSISILIFINSIDLIRQRKMLPYMLCCLLGMTFHLSSILYIPLYFFLHRPLNKWWFLAIFAGGNIIYLLNISVFGIIVSFIAGFISPELQLRIDTYMDFLPNLGFKLSIGYLERLLTGILVFIYFDKLKEIRKENVIFINCIILYLAFFFFFSEFKVIGQRFATLFSVGYWMLWMDLIPCFKYKNNQQLFAAFLAIYCIFKIYGSTDDVISRYDNVLFGSESYHVRQNIYNRNYNDVE